MAERNIFRQIEDKVADTIFGPETNGTIEAVVDDPNEIGRFYLFVSTPQGKMKRFSLEETTLVYRYGEGLQPVGMPFKRGESISIRARGTDLRL